MVLLEGRPDDRPIFQQRAYQGLLERDQGERGVEVPSRSEYEPEQRTCFGCNVGNILLRVERRGHCHSEIAYFVYSLQCRPIEDIIVSDWSCTTFVRDDDAFHYVQLHEVLLAPGIDQGSRVGPLRDSRRTLNGAERHPSYLTTRVLSVK
ncbi:hypothetical protein J6590_007216 [Homalodisca vitripennis]|nr:hypothetical protein J6590_007216 [Homalodisca vitripennis]